jgi:low temperature requirement protein LtrA
MRIAVSRAPGSERVVTPLELFFDLVYVFAIGQLSHHLVEHVDGHTLATLSDERDRNADVGA